MQRSEAGLYWALTRVPIIDPATGDLVRGTLVMAAPSFWGTPLFFDFKPWLAALAAALTLFVLCWMPFIRGLGRSISRLTANTGRIAQGDFENHLPENRRDEIGQLSVSINRMAERLSGFVTGQKRFLGDIAHELSAPIARIQFALGILDQRASEEQREAMEDLREEIAQMSSLVGELMSFSKAGLGAGKTALVPTDVNAIAQQAAVREATGAAGIVVEIPEAVSALAEPNLLMRALSNLLRNAVRYAGAGGPITISAKRQGDFVLISVTDSGPGLPAEELERVFAPFYRLDASRNRDTGGAGLGLAIVKSCVEASGGSVICRNREPHGLEVEIRLRAAL
jgi:two-component system sensor histidine kinase CpxA